MGSSKPGATTAGIRVLIVDDHALFRRGLREHLEASGLDVVGEAEDAAGAVALSAETEPEVVLMDIRCREARASTRPEGCGSRSRALGY